MTDVFCVFRLSQPSDLANLVVNSTTIVSLEEGKHELTFKSF